MVQKNQKDTGKKEDDEVLDEAAMRAADIHEVMTGLLEFRQRIIDGKALSKHNFRLLHIRP